MSEEKINEVVLIIADISGYTEFMLSSKMEIKHGQAIITKLIESVLNEVDIPIELSKLEGDAIFLYAIKGRDGLSWDELKQKVGEKLLLFFDKFHKALLSLTKSKMCSCTACDNILNLKLKLVVHSGKALFYQIQHFNELSGPDVILVHRLLKNSIKQKEYILMTETAYSDLTFPSTIEVKKGSEKYEHFGKIKTLVYYPERSEAFIKLEKNLMYRFKKAVLKMLSRLM